MDNAEQNANQFVFGLDIGTRNVVGTVGYREGKDFYVAAQYMKEHETRAMLDGQIHDIGRVGRTIAEVIRGTVRDKAYRCLYCCCRPRSENSDHQRGI